MNDRLEKLKDEKRILQHRREEASEAGQFDIAASIGDQIDEIREQIRIIREAQEKADDALIDEIQNDQLNDYLNDEI